MGTPSLQVSTLHIQNSTVSAVAGKSLKSGSSKTYVDAILTDLRHSNSELNGASRSSPEKVGGLLLCKTCIHSCQAMDNGHFPVLQDMKNGLLRKTI